MLSTRRKINRLSIFNKAIGGHLAIPVQNYLQPAQRQTRRSKSNNYIEHQARLDCYKYSFIPRTIRDWNNLPANISSISEPILFKEAVTKYLSEQEKQVKRLSNIICIAHTSSFSPCPTRDVEKYLRRRRRRRRRFPDL